MGFDSVSAVLIAIAFLVPGFILSSILAMTFRRRSRSAGDLTLQYLTLSCVNYGLWSWLIVLMVQGNWLASAPTRSAFVVFGVVFVSPVVLGLIASRSYRSEWVHRILSGFGFKMHRFIPTAWDFRFEQELPAWVIVRLKDGSSVYGFLGLASFAGDEPHERDLFVEAVFVPTEEGHWQPAADTGGILIKGSEIATIEFRRVDSTTGES